MACRADCKRAVNVQQQQQQPLGPAGGAPVAAGSSGPGQESSALRALRIAQARMVASPWSCQWAGGMLVLLLVLA